MPAINMVDGAITIRILHMLVTPWNKTPAFKHGIIDADGNPLRRSSDLKTPDEKGAYTVLWRLVFKLKRILGKIPMLNKTLVNYAAALWLIKECEEQLIDPENVEQLYEEYLQKDLSEAMLCVDEFLEESQSFELITLMLKEEGVPVNNVGSGNIAGMNAEGKPGKLVRRKKKKVA